MRKASKWQEDYLCTVLKVPRITNQEIYLKILIKYYFVVYILESIFSTDQEREMLYLLNLIFKYFCFYMNFTDKIIQYFSMFLFCQVISLTYTIILLLISIFLQCVVFDKHELAFYDFMHQPMVLLLRNQLCYLLTKLHVHTFMKDFLMVVFNRGCDIKFIELIY